MALINHLSLHVSDLDRSEAFYDPICAFLGYHKHARNGAILLYRKTHGIGDLILLRVRKAGQGKTYDCEAPGFSHLAWNADSHKQVDDLYRLLKKHRATILDAPCEMNYSRGYYAVWFQDPDGMKLELAYTPHQSPDNPAPKKRRTKSG
jgi:catechol 2,3-dioxygenase-like lactoylglutathione lyase family enzyme